ncbi:MAG: hypothetical protein NTV03_01575 [Candidatus Nomurabacteria bacterium]|nr:hypothetical protein [Candidatus Nomurabacteria bacterium]
MNTENKSLAEEEIKEAVGCYTFSIEVEKDIEVLELFKNPYVIALKCSIKQGNKLLGIGRANSFLSQRNKWVKTSTLYTWNAAFTDALSKALKLLNELPLKNITQKETEDITEEIDEGRDKPVFFTNTDDLKYASKKQIDFCFKLLNGKCKDETKKQDYLKRLKSPYISSFQASEIISNLLSKK